MKQEVYKKVIIDGVVTNYSVSNFGNVRNDKRNNILKPNIDKSGYYYVNICDNKLYSHKKVKQNSIKIHKLVAKAFLPNEENKREVNHIDCNKLNNNVNNLEWVSSSENKKHAVKNGLMFVDTSYAIEANKVKVYVEDIKGNFIGIFESQKECAKKLKLNKSCITLCCQGKQKKTKGYVIRYA